MVLAGDDKTVIIQKISFTDHNLLPDVNNSGKWAEKSNLLISHVNIYQYTNFYRPFSVINTLLKDSFNRLFKGENIFSILMAF